MSKRAKTAAPRATAGGAKRSSGTSAGRRSGLRAKKGKVRRADPRRIIALSTRRPRGGRGVGLAAGVCIVEAVGGAVEVASAGKEHVQVGAATVGRADSILARAGRKLGRGVNWERAGEALAAAGNVHRLQIMAYLLEGPATYRALQKATGLQVGPLYHHIDKLRLAGLMGPKERDLYTLTRAGRNLILLAIVAVRLLKDRRLRPQPVE